MQKECGPNARIDCLAAVGQSQFNNDYGQVKQLVIGRKSQTNDYNTKELGELHKLPAKLQASMVVVAKKKPLKWNKHYDARVSRQQEVKRGRRDMVVRKYGHFQGRIHSGNVFFGQYHSTRCWDTVVKTRDRYKALKSGTKKLAAVREQFLIQ